MSRPISVEKLKVRIEKNSEDIREIKEKIKSKQQRKEIKNDLINKVDRMQLVDLILVQNAVDILIARDKMETSKR